MEEAFHRVCGAASDHVGDDVDVRDLHAEFAALVVVGVDGAEGHKADLLHAVGVHRCGIDLEGGCSSVGIGCGGAGQGELGACDGDAVDGSQKALDVTHGVGRLDGSFECSHRQCGVGLAVLVKHKVSTDGFAVDGDAELAGELGGVGAVGGGGPVGHDTGEVHSDHGDLAIVIDGGFHVATGLHGELLARFAKEAQGARVGVDGGEHVA